MRNSIFPASHMFFINDAQEILLQRRFQTGFHDGKYGVPSGHAEKNETATDAAIREAAEEANLKIEAQDLKMVHIMYYIKNTSANDYNCYFLRVAKWHGEPKIMEPDKCDDLRWFSLSALPDNMIEHIRYALDEYLKGNFYSEWRNGI